MLVAIFGRPFKEDNIPAIQLLLYRLLDKGVRLCLHQQFASYLEQVSIDFPITSERFTSSFDFPEADFVISIGGDGTLLETVTFVGSKEIPIVGINTGRLGFLAATRREEIEIAIDELISKHYRISERTLLKLISNADLFGGIDFALNELTISKIDSSSMITVHTYVDGEFLNSYWADGLIVSTPTGSTGYSLSCGGPLMHPSTQNFIITPISPHNLNVRPMVISDESYVSFEIEGRSQNFLISLDSRSKIVSSDIKLALKKESFKVKLIELKTNSYFKTLRSKLNWGFDARN